jgi:hypothetical protein
VLIWKQPEMLLAAHQACSSGPQGDFKHDTHFGHCQTQPAGTATLADMPESQNSTAHESSSQAVSSQPPPSRATCMRSTAQHSTAQHKGTA